MRLAALVCVLVASCSHPPPPEPLLHHEVPIDRRLERLVIARVDQLHMVQGVVVSIRHERGATWKVALRNITDVALVVHWERSTLRLVDETAMGVLHADAKHVAPQGRIEVDVTPELLVALGSDPHMWTLVREAVFEISMTLGDRTEVWRGMIGGDLKGPRVDEALLERLGSKEPATGKPSVPAAARVTRFHHYEATEP